MHLWPYTFVNLNKNSTKFSVDPVSDEILLN